ncbi:hypothetical protein SAMN05446037_101873 [Anaerovirgula multivorans]|uniref:Uncharacterized protein n=1 Tax=Anaerovirgula multivorans TaxID=312168 RepID=A0A239GUI0_9FIRM|nr:hypothetical protein SAMN05446037_101873 [Anaerovirgula multivorans]
MLPLLITIHLHKGAGGTCQGKGQSTTPSHWVASTTKKYSFGVQFEGVANAKTLVDIGSLISEYSFWVIIKM